MYMERKKIMQKREVSAGEIVTDFTRKGLLYERWIRLTTPGQVNKMPKMGSKMLVPTCLAFLYSTVLYKPGCVP